MSKVSRRDFLRTAGVLAGGALLSGCGKKGLWVIQSPPPPPPPPQKSLVIVATHDQATDTRGNIYPVYVQRIVDAAIIALTGQVTVGEAWLSLFPDLKSTSIIGIKVNCLNASRLVSHKEMAEAIAKGLAQMPLGNGTFSENNVIVWDRSNSELTSNGGYSLNTGTTDWRCFGTDQGGVGYSTTAWDVAGISQNPSRLLSERCDFLINLAVLKHHSESEVSLTLKNHYGSIHDPGSLHANLCDPYIAALNRTIRQILPGKQVLAMVDCLYGCYSGGPSGPPQFFYKGLIMSRDPVACDQQGLSIINTQRQSRSLTPLQPPHLVTAASYGLGTNDPAAMDVRTITNP
jgi:uncharacterized protein (DUF362 family)